MEERERDDGRAAELGKDLVDEGHAGQDTLGPQETASAFERLGPCQSSEKTDLGLAPQGRFLLSLSDDETAIVERGRVFVEPVGDDSLPRRRQQVRIVAERSGDRAC